MRWLLTVSAFLVCGIAWAGTYGDLKDKLAGAESDADVIRIVKEDPVASSQPDIAGTLDRTDASKAEIAETLRSQVDLAAMDESNVRAPSGQAEKAKAIKASPFYNDVGIDEKRNWLAGAFERFKNIHMKRDRSNGEIRGGGFLGPIAVFLMWALLAAGIVALIYFAVRHFRWQSTLKRKTNAMLEENEPDRTLDEWLELANKHAEAGRYREAVRALYLACLLKFDEADVARFDRGETNWEHLARIEQSEGLPESLDFRTPTRRFDIIWYGRKTEGMSDVVQFREWYSQIGEALRKVPA